MLAGLATGEGDGICVQDLGLSGVTEADGLAVARPSGLVAGLMRHIVSGGFTVDDAMLFENLRLLYDAENLFIEPSACAAFAGYTGLAFYPAAERYLTENGLNGRLSGATHVLWATGGSLVPESVRIQYLKKRL
ncbi:D-serine dehydratase [bioreactor metagenome]|uniref:D-serine dehydratase n=1 Tax=bioreactor metagenome TaxID=1076179 RepID=A0A645JRD9_9ZZZZ